MNVVILGAGLLGVTSAYFLRQQGHEVTVIDRQAQPAAETSFANGGQVSVSHAEPWANPGAPLKLLKWLGREDAPLLFRLRPDLRQWLWGLQFLRECTPARTRHNIEQIVRLGTYSRQTLQQLRRERGLAYDQRTQGILHFYTSEKEFDGAEAPAAQMRALGCDRRVISADEAVRLEPALRHIRPQLAGATYTAEDESGDAHLFTRELVQRCVEDGVRFRMSHTVTALREVGGELDHVEVTDAEGRFQQIRADAYVLALGSLSPQYAKALGMTLPIYPAKGYSVTMPVKDASRAHQVSLTDDEYKLVFSRLGDRLRIAGTAEFNGHDRDLNRVALRGDRASGGAALPRRGRHRPSAVLDRPAPGHAEQRADHRPLAAAPALPQYRPRHARLDARLRLGQEHRRDRQRAAARGRLRVHGAGAGRIGLRRAKRPYRGGVAGTGR